MICGAYCLIIIQKHLTLPLPLPYMGGEYLRSPRFNKEYGLATMCKAVFSCCQGNKDCAGRSLRLEVQRLLDGLNFLVSSLQAALIVGSTLEARVFHLQIELDLGLGA